MTFVEGSPTSRDSLLSPGHGNRQAKMSRTPDDEWKCLDYGAWAGEISIRIILGTVFVISATAIQPFLRHVEVNDWHNYNFPHAEPETIHPETVFVLICIFPSALVILTSLIRPGWSAKYNNAGNQSKFSPRVNRRIVSEITIAILCVTMAYFTNGLITDVIKNAYGRPRPDFLSRCFTPTAYTTKEEVFLKANGDNLWLTLPSRQFPLSNTDAQMEAIRRFGVNGTEVGDVPFPYIEDVKSLVDIPDCINSAGGKSLLLRGGRRSFPSGHTSFAFAGSTWCALYCFYWLSKLKSTMNLGMGSVKFPGASVSLGIFFLWFTPAIYVGISRTQDYRHHPSDVIAGAIIGIFSVSFTFLQYYNFHITPFYTNNSTQGAKQRAKSLVDNHSDENNC